MKTKDCLTVFGVACVIVALVYVLCIVASVIAGEMCNTFALTNVALVAFALLIIGCGAIGNADEI